MLEFNNCCFCIPLRTGCLILGYLHLVGSVVIIVLSSLDLATIIMVVTRNIEVDKAAASVTITSAAVLQLLAIVLLVFSILLIVGLHKEKKNYVKAYLIYYVIFIVLFTILYIVQIVVRRPIGLVYTLGNLIQILLSVYFVLVIRSHWVTMRENSGNNFNTAYSAARSES